MDPQEPATDDLLLRAREGGSAERNDLLARYRGRLVQVVAVRLDPRLRGRLDPSDVVQEALADAHRHLPEYLEAPPLPFFAWLRQFAWNRLIDLHRQHLKAQRRSVLREEAGPLPLPDDSAAELARRLACSGTSPSDAAGREDHARVVLEALGRLADKDREVLELRYLEGLSVLETAAVLGVSEGAVKLRHLRALRKIRKVLDVPREEGHGA